MNNSAECLQSVSKEKEMKSQLKQLEQEELSSVNKGVILFVCGNRLYNGSEIDFIAIAASFGWAYLVLRTNRNRDYS